MGLATLEKEPLSQYSYYDRSVLSLYRRDIVDTVKWAWFYTIGWHPHIYQMQMHTSTARERYSTSGRRGGKTEWAAHEASAYMVAGPYRVWDVGPTYDDVFKEFRVVLKDLQHPACPHTIVRALENKQAGHLYILLSNGAEFEGISLAQADRSPAIGEEIDLLILSEGARIRNLSGDGGIWETQLRGNLTTRVGDMICPTTPAGKDKWLYPRFIKAETEDDPNAFALRWPAYANPAYLEDVVYLRRTMSPRAFDQEVLGLFVSWEGAIWVEDCGFSDHHVIDSFIPPVWWNRYEIIDPGFSDWFFWLAGVVDDYGTLYIVDEYKARRTRYKDLAEAIGTHREIMYSGNVPDHIPVYVDPEDPRCRMELMSAGRELDEPVPLYCLPADNNVWSGFEAGSTRLRTDTMFVCKNCINTIDALNGHEWGERTNSKGRKIEKRDEYKHPSDCARYLVKAPLRISVRPVIKKRGEFDFNDLLKWQNEEQNVGGEYGSALF